MDQAAVQSERGSHIWCLSRLLSSAIIVQQQPRTRQKRMSMTQQWLVLISADGKSREKEYRFSNRVGGSTKHNRASLQSR